jgi:hypothetical protein
MVAIFFLALVGESTSGFVSVNLDFMYSLIW